jgi:hypothetical protein
MAITLWRSKADKATREAEKARLGEIKAHRKVTQAVTKVQLERAKQELKSAQLERKTRLSIANAALKRAQAEENRAKAEMWESRRAKIGAIVRLPNVDRKKAKKASKALAKGATIVGRAILGEPTTKRRTAKRKRR